MEKKAFSVLLIAVSMALLLGLLPIHGEREIYESVVRLHVLANSDSDEDQALKLKVRDSVIKFTDELLSDCETRDEAAVLMGENLEGFEKVANSVLLENGSDQRAKVVFGEEYYPTRVYEDAAFPSGKYLSLQIKIGEAEGKNWWCVLFPPICLSAASKKDESLENGFIAAGLTGEQYRIITESNTDGGKYEIRFKILEIFEEIIKRFK
ncbi:MAG: stage II sporulation protein R [Clostridia bacterium]|nr:stage II sporulation protein R [Clostridia bacterium]